MKALDWNRPYTGYDGLEALAPSPQTIRLPAVDCALAPTAAAAAGVLAAALILLSGNAAGGLIAALGGVSALLYLGTALLAARTAPALLDLTAGIAALVVSVSQPAAAVSGLLVHAVWGILRGAWPGIAPGRRFAASWAAFHATAGLLLGLAG
jgi:hypothetical protein